jgi:TetR/AcrR family transcriptional regulator, repressor for uid operon
VAPESSRDQVLRGTYECIARVGIAKTTMDDAARAAGVSRATVYRLFPGGRDALLRETVGWEMTRFFAHLGEVLGAATDFAEFLERAIPLARDELVHHVVLQKVLETEPDRLIPLITVEQHRLIAFISAYFLPMLERDRERGVVRLDIDLPRAAEYVARMALSLVASPGRHDLDDAAEVHWLVRRELLGGLLTDPHGDRAGDGQ